MFQLNKENLWNTFQFAGLSALGAALSYLASHAGAIDPVYGPALGSLAAVVAKLIQQWVSPNTPAPQPDGGSNFPIK